MRARWTLIGGGVLLAGVVALVLWLQYAPVDQDPVELPPPGGAAPGTPSAARPPPRRTAGEPAPPPLAPPPATVPPEQYDGPTGIALFPPHGTKRIKTGIIVPEGYEPPGYVRHYQTTDDGVRLPAVLMFHPDFTPKDESGKPIDLPSRMVPPELAPKGMPIQFLEQPEGQRAPD